MPMKHLSTLKGVLYTQGSDLMGTDCLALNRYLQAGYISISVIDWTAHRVGATRSTTEAEHIALYLGGREAFFVRGVWL